MSEETEHLKALRNEVSSLTEKIGKAVKPEDFETLKGDISSLKESGASKEEITKLNDKFQEQQEEINRLKEDGGSDTVKSFDQQVYEALKGAVNDLGSIKGNKEKEVKFTIKDPSTTTTGNVDFANGVTSPASFTYQGINSIIPKPEKIPFVQNFTNNAPTGLVSIPWIDEVNQEGDAAFIGEGVVKPLIEVEYEIRYSQAKKVAGKIKVSEEALTDIPFMQAEITRKLRQRHDLALQEGILNGDGSNANLLGITEYAAAFAAGGLAASIDRPQNYDAIIAAIHQIIVTSDSNYMPNAVFVHPTDATIMKLTKDEDGNYILPPFTTNSGQVIDNVQVVQNTKIPVGFFLIGDFSKSNVRTYVNFSIRIGYTGDDFERNLVTILGESRVHHYISENEKIAFVYDEFDTVKEAIAVVEPT